MIGGNVVALLAPHGKRSKSTETKNACLLACTTNNDIVNWEQTKSVEKDLIDPESLNLLTV